MIKTMLVAASGTAQTTAALNTAVALARLFRGHFECLHVRQSPAQMVAKVSSADLGSGTRMAAMLQMLEREDEEHCGVTRAAFDDVCRREQIAMAERPTAEARISGCWRQERGDETDHIINRSRAHDLVVVEHPSGAGLTASALGSVVVGTGCPVLVTAPDGPNDFAGTIAIAWKDSSEAARAVIAAMPLLSKARRIIVLSATEDVSKEEKVRSSMQAVVERLQWHRFPAEGQLIPSENALAGVMDVVAQIKPGLLVMGGYGHGRFREFVLGGFTRHVLAGIATPTLLMH
jgi:nucleotide-binding universal stress UspA family protein